MLKVLIISLNEICFNPRLIKAADFLLEKNADITVFNPLVGMTDANFYNSFVQRRNWKIIRNDISKFSTKSKLRWFFISILWKFFIQIFKLFPNLKTNRYILNKGLIGAKKKLCKEKFDVILINLVHNLPFAVDLKKKNKGSILIYDSQEFFTGQYATAPELEKNWVNLMEKNFISEVDILLATTNVLKGRLQQLYNLNIPAFRVRNLPRVNIQNAVNQPLNNPLKIVWHGYIIVYENARGIHIMMKAVSLCKQKPCLYLQGKITESEKHKINNAAQSLGIENNIIILPPADPDFIVDSLQNYDLGVTGELPAEENQMLTSSNKIFEYIAAGLPVIAPDVPGIAETFLEYKIGQLYKTGNSEELATIIDQWTDNPDVLLKFKENAKKTAQENIHWDKDFAPVWDSLMKLQKS